MIIGQQYIAGKWVRSEQTFRSSPSDGLGREFSSADARQVDEAVEAAEDAFVFYSQLKNDTRAAFLNRIALELENRKDPLLQICTIETGLPLPRLEVEFFRTVSQLRFFANHILDSQFTDFRHDVAMPDRQPMPRPDLKLIQRPLGPVAVFGASNFPMAFSTLGGDTASALAAGCSVVVKGHSAHPGTADISAQAMEAAVLACGIRPGVFSQIQGSGFVVGQALVKHPLIRAVGFTGSLAGGRALFDLCAARPEPIPFYGELGSVNPVFMLPGALDTRLSDLASGWAESVSASAGQFCTNPGVVVLQRGYQADKFIESASQILKNVPVQTMLTDGICESFSRGRDRLRASLDTIEVLSSVIGRRTVTPALFTTEGEAWLNNDTLAHEVFGPLGIVVLVKDESEMINIAKSLEGQLVGTMQMASSDTPFARQLLPLLERKVGRVVVNGFPTGVEVCDAMVHGGPYPASTNFGATSVGSLAIRRFLRPVSYQNLPDELWADVAD